MVSRSLIATESKQAEISRSERNKSLSAQEIIEQYKRVDQGVSRPDVIQMITHYPKWKYQEWTKDRIGGLQWVFHPEQGDHISVQLSQGGKKRSVRDIALRYEEQRNMLPNEFREKIEGMVASYLDGKRLPPLIVIPGDKYPEAPESDFIDGVHRALALYLAYLRHPDIATTLQTPVFIGEKASALLRLARKLWPPKQPRLHTDQGTAANVLQNEGAPASLEELSQLREIDDYFRYRMFLKDGIYAKENSVLEKISQLDPTEDAGELHDLIAICSNFLSEASPGHGVPHMIEKIQRYRQALEKQLE